MHEDWRRTDDKKQAELATYFTLKSLLVLLNRKLNYNHIHNCFPESLIILGGNSDFWREFSHLTALKLWPPNQKRLWGSFTVAYFTTSVREWAHAA